MPQDVSGTAAAAGASDRTGAVRALDPAMTAPRLAGAIRLPDGSWVRGRALRRPQPEGATPDYGLYLGTRRFRRRHQQGLRWPHHWVEWPDFLLPRDREHAIGRILGLHEHARAGRRVEVACAGGVGRTGTVIACLAVLAGLPPGEAVAWARANYHRRAVETPWQRGWVARFPRTEPVEPAEPADPPGH